MQISKGKILFDVTLEGDTTLLRPLLREAGGHRWQRVPPNERRGRVHSSSVTVAVFEIRPQAQWRLQDRDIETFFTKDTGPGGQHRNKTESCVVMRHKPTGIEAKSATRSQFNNRELAREVLEARVAAHYANQVKAAQDADRRAQLGSGQRGDKVRTYRAQDDQVTDHRSGKKARLKDVTAGKLDALIE